MLVRANEIFINEKDIFVPIDYLSFSCKKDSDITALKSSIVGSWEFENFSGYPFINRALPPGNGKIIALGKDGSFKRM